MNHGTGAPHTLNVATPFDDGNVWHVWVDYDGTTMEVRANQTGARPVASMLTREFSGANGTQTLAQILGQMLGLGAALPAVARRRFTA